MFSVLMYAHFFHLVLFFSIPILVCKTCQFTFSFKVLKTLHFTVMLKFQF